MNCISVELTMKCFDLVLVGQGPMRVSLSWGPEVQGATQALQHNCQHVSFKSHQWIPPCTSHSRSPVIDPTTALLVPPQMAKGGPMGLFLQFLHCICHQDCTKTTNTNTASNVISQNDSCPGYTDFLNCFVVGPSRPVQVVLIVRNDYMVKDGSKATLSIGSFSA